MTDVFAYTKAQKLNWVKRLYKNCNTVPYEILASKLDIPVDIFLKSSCDPTQITRKIPLFYREILEAWFELKSNSDISQDIQREVVWYNKYIKINNSMIFNNTMLRNGVIFVNDIIKLNTGSFLSYGELLLKY